MLKFNVIISSVIISFFLMFPYEDFKQYVEIDVISVHDGDTIKANVILPGKVSLINENVRFDYDAWEVGHRNGKNITDAEKIKGQKAKKDFEELLENSDKVYGEFFSKDTRDSFGRLLIKPTLKMKDGSIVELNKYMADKGNIRK